MSLPSIQRVYRGAGMVSTSIFTCFWAPQAGQTTRLIGPSAPPDRARPGRPSPAPARRTRRRTNPGRRRDAPRRTRRTRRRRPSAPAFLAGVSWGRRQASYRGDVAPRDPEQPVRGRVEVFPREVPAGEGWPVRPLARVDDEQGARVLRLARVARLWVFLGEIPLRQRVRARLDARPALARLPLIAHGRRAVVLGRLRPAHHRRIGAGRAGDRASPLRGRGEFAILVSETFPPDPYAGEGVGLEVIPIGLDLSVPFVLPVRPMLLRRRETIKHLAECRVILLSHAPSLPIRAIRSV